MKPTLKQHLELSDEVNTALELLRKASQSPVLTSTLAGKVMAAMKHLEIVRSQAEDRGFSAKIPGYSIGVFYPNTRTVEERTEWEHLAPVQIANAPRRRTRSCTRRPR